MSSSVLLDKIFSSREEGEGCSLFMCRVSVDNRTTVDSILFDDTLRTRLLMSSARMLAFSLLRQLLRLGAVEVHAKDLFKLALSLLRNLVEVVVDNIVVFMRSKLCRAILKFPRDVAWHSYKLGDVLELHYTIVGDVLVLRLSEKSSTEQNSLMKQDLVLVSEKPFVLKLRHEEVRGGRRKVRYSLVPSASTPARHVKELIVEKFVQDMLGAARLGIELEES